LEADSVTSDIVAASADNLIRLCPGETQTQRDLKVIWGLREYYHRRKERINALNFLYTAVKYIKTKDPELIKENSYSLYGYYHKSFNTIQRLPYIEDGDNKTVERNMVNALEAQFADVIDLYHKMFT
jgi:hypothetical protein